MSSWNSQGRMKIKEDRTMSRSPRVQNLFQVTQPQRGKGSSSSISLMEAGSLSTMPLRSNSMHDANSEMFDSEPEMEYHLKSEVDYFPRARHKGYGRRISTGDTLHQRLTPEEDALSYLDDVLSQDLDRFSFTESNSNMNSNKQKPLVSISNEAIQNQLYGLSQGICQVYLLQELHLLHVFGIQSLVIYGLLYR